MDSRVAKGARAQMQVGGGQKVLRPRAVAFYHILAMRLHLVIYHF